MPQKVITIFTCILSLISLNTYCQHDSLSTKRQFFIEPELMAGKIVANHQEYPSIGIRNNYLLNIGVRHTDKSKHWQQFYNFPTAGVSFSASKLGNNDVFGYEYGIVPYILINTSRKKLNAWHFKFGLGASYFSKYFDPFDNPDNRAIGSRYTWTFNVFLYRKFLVTDKVSMSLGGGYWHSSNGHTQLPNFGLNSAMLTMSTTFYTKKVNQSFFSDREAKSIDRKKAYFFNLRQGFGIHELGGTSGPVGGAKKLVYVTSLSGGIILKQHIKIRTGIAYRFYQHFNDFLLLNHELKTKEKTAWEASNIYFFIGCEFLIGHFGMDIEGGINLYKPFYKTFYELYGNGNQFKYWLKKTFPARLGLNTYLFNTNNRPKNNLFLGIHINANFGKADFSEVSVGYTRILK